MNGLNDTKKYVFTGKTRVWGRRTLKQIRACVEIKNAFGQTVYPGDVGGWIEKEDNLSHEGNAWVADNARVSGNAWVFGNAQVSGNAWVCGNAWVYSNAWVYGDALVCGVVRVYGHAQVCGDAWVHGDAQVCNDAYISKNGHWFTAGPMRGTDDFVTFFRNKAGMIKVNSRDFIGSVEELFEADEITIRDNKHDADYRAAAVLAVEQIDVSPIKDDWED